MDNSNRDAVEESEVQNLFYLIDVEKKGVITVQDARLAKELIRERFCIDEVGGVLIVILSSPNLLKHFTIIYFLFHQQFQDQPSGLDAVKWLFSVFSMLTVAIGVSEGLS